MTRLGSVFAGLCILSTGSVPIVSQQPAPTRVIHFVPPGELPERVIQAACGGTSTAAWFRADAERCTAGSVTFDPCFKTARAGLLFCAIDPRQPASAALVASAPQPAPADPPVNPVHRAWFFELADGTTCQPLPAPGREIDGEIELYGCRFGSGGEADAVLGDLDASSPVWTIHKLLINKKAQPQTVKSLTVASVRTVWQ